MLKLYLRNDRQRLKYAARCARIAERFVFTENWEEALEFWAAARRGIVDVADRMVHPRLIRIVERRISLLRKAFKSVLFAGSDPVDF